MADNTWQHLDVLLVSQQLSAWPGSGRQWAPGVMWQHLAASLVCPADTRVGCSSGGRRGPVSGISAFIIRDPGGPAHHRGKVWFSLRISPWYLQSQWCSLHVCGQTVQFCLSFSFDGNPLLLRSGWNSHSAPFSPFFQFFSNSFLLPC